ncbi:two-component system, sensor histidine kinase [uncultured Gammaproteobacteria bacterium]
MTEKGRTASQGEDGGPNHHSGLHHSGLIANLAGFKGRLAMALLSTAVITVIASTVAVLSFQRFGTMLNRESEEILPLLTASLALSQQSTLLAATAPVLATARDTEQVAGLEVQIDGFFSETRRALATLRARYPGETVERIVQVSGAMSSALKALQRITLDRLRLSTRKDARQAELGRIQERFLNAVSPLFETARSRLGDAARQAAEVRTMTLAGPLAGKALPFQTEITFSSLFNRIIDSFRLIMSLRTEGDTLLALLKAGSDAIDEVGVSQAAFRFNQSLGAFQRSLTGFAAESGQDEPSALATLHEFHQTIAGLGQRADSLFDLHREELDLAERTATALLANQTTAGYLLTNVNRLVAAIETDVAGQRHTLDQHVENSKTTLIFLCLGAVLLATLIAGRTIQTLGTHEHTLRDARDQAETANRAKSDFLATMSHEMRTPLNGVLGLTTMLSETGHSQEQREICRIIIDSGEQLLRIIDDILDYSMMEGGNHSLEAYAFAPEMPAQSVIALLSDQAKAKGLVLACEISPWLPAIVIGDPGRLQKVLHNLIANAIKFTPSGKITLRIGRDNDHSGPMVDGRQTMATLRYEVEDTGIGIAESDFGRLFIPFTQLDSSLARQHGGTGLGLALSKRVIDLLGGKIGVTSTPKQGSTFWFTVRMPLADATERSSVAASPLAFDENEGTTARAPTGHQPDSSDPTEVELAPDAAGMAGNNPPMANGTILLAEDNPTNSRMAVRLLRNAGFRVEVVENGADAVALVARFGFDLVLMDIQMPEMDGLTAARGIRALPPPASLVPIVALTANALRGDRELCLAAGMDDYLPKPINRSQLLEMIRRRIKSPAGTVPVSTTGSVPAENNLNLGQSELNADMLEELIETFGIDEAREVMAAFLNETRFRVKAIATAVDRGDRGTLEREAHTLKGNAANLGMARLGLIAATVVAACRADALSDAVAPARSLPERFERACAELQRHYPALVAPIKPNPDTAT